MGAEFNVGFIGAGKMGGALIRGFINGGAVEPKQLFVSGGKSNRTAILADELGFHLEKNARGVVEKSDVIFLAVKPSLVEAILSEISEILGREKIVVSVAVNPDIAVMESCLNTGAKVIRTLPNTPSEVLAGMTSVSLGDQVRTEDWEKVAYLLEAVGKTELIDEALMNVASAVAGSSPAFVDLFIEALADGGVSKGLPRESAYKLAAQAVLGAAQLVVETGKLPAELKDQVCSPGGTTIAGVRKLEEKGLRSAVIEAVTATVEAAER